MRLNHDTVLGYLRDSGTRDPDALHFHKQALVSRGRIPKLVGICAVLLGLLAMTTVSAFIGTPLVVLGCWMWRRGVRNLATIEACHSEYVGGAPYPSSTEGFDGA